MENEKMNVIVVEPGKQPYVKEIPDTLESLQKEVGGYIQAIYPYEDAVAIICAEEGKLMGMPFNRALRDEPPRMRRLTRPEFIPSSLRSTSVLRSFMQTL